MGSKSASSRENQRALRPVPTHAKRLHRVLPGSKAQEELSGLRDTPIAQAAPPQTVLVVDDEPMIRSLLACLLEPLGYRVLETDNGAEALRLVRRDHPHIDLVLLDFQLPELDGVAVLRALRESSPELPVVLQTGHGPAELSARLGDLRADGVLEKPFRADTLATVVEAALRPPTN